MEVKVDTKINLSVDDRFTRALLGLSLISAAFIGWGKWFIIAIGIALLISAMAGYCMTNEIFKKMRSRGEYFLDS